VIKYINVVYNVIGMGIKFIRKLLSSPRWNVWLGEMDGERVVVKAPAFTITRREIEYYTKRAAV